MKFYHRLRTKLVVIVCLVTIIPVMMTGMYAIRVATHTLTTQAVMEQMEQAKNLKEAMESLLASTKTDLLFLSQSPAMEDYLELRTVMLIPQSTKAEIQASEQAVTKVVQNVLEQKRQTLQREFLAFSRNHRLYSQVIYLDEMGLKVVRIEADGIRSEAAKSPTPTGLDYFKDTNYLGGKQVLVSPLELDREGQEIKKPYQPVIYYAINVNYKNSRKAGLIVLTVDANLFLKPLGETILIDQEGYFLNHPNCSQKCWGGPRDLKTGQNVDQEYPNLRPLLMNQDGNLTVGKLMIFHQKVFIPGSNQKWVLIIQSDAEKIFSSVKTFQRTFILIIGFSILVTLTFAWLFSARMTRSLELLTQAAEAISKGELMEHRIEISDQGEIGQLAQAFERMRISMLKSFERLRKPR